MRSSRVWAATALALSLAAVARGQGVVVSHGVPGELEAATPLAVPIELENRGSSTWDPAAGFALSYHWIGEAGEVVVWDGVRTELPLPVGPGERIDLIAAVEVPRFEGELKLQWDIVREGEYWLADVTEPPSLQIPVIVRAGYAFSVVDGSAPWWLITGRDVTRRLALRNDGTRAWPIDGSVALSYHWITKDGEPAVWDGARTPLPVAVEPGGEVVVEARLVAPESAGRFRLQWDMVREGVAWFSQRDPTPEPLRSVRVFVPPWSSLASWALVSLTLAMVVVTVARRGRPVVLLGAVALADVIWCAIAIVVKQQAVLTQAGHPGGLRGALISLAGVSLLLLPALLLPRRVRAWSCWALAALATALLFADLIYERFFGDLLSIAVIGAAAQLSDVRASVVSLLAPSDAWFWLDLLAGAAIALAVARAPRRIGRGPTAIAAVALGAAVIAGALSAAAVVRTGVISLGQVFRNVAVAREIGVLSFHVLDVGRALATTVRRPALDPAEVDRLTSWFARSGAAPRR